LESIIIVPSIGCWPNEASGSKKTRINQERLDSKVKRVQNTNEDPWELPIK
ncbi:hypothetical protein L9F63_003099, partial [Diploptera punctata]